MGQVKFTINKDDALDIVKEAISSKAAILKDNGYELKVGSPMMTATIKVGDGIIDINGSGPGKVIASTCESAIGLAIKKAEKEKNAPAITSINIPVESPLDEEIKILTALKLYKQLYDLEEINYSLYAYKHKEFVEKLNKYLEKDSDYTLKKDTPEDLIIRLKWKKGMIKSNYLNYLGELINLSNMTRLKFNSKSVEFYIVRTKYIISFFDVSEINEFKQEIGM